MKTIRPNGSTAAHSNWATIDDDVFDALASRAPLSPDRERELAERIVAGRAAAADVAQFAAGAAARNELIESNMRLAIGMAKRYRGFGITFDDLMAEAFVGLCSAADKFEPGREARFATFASIWIRQSILQALSRSSLIRLPAYQYWRTCKDRPGRSPDGLDVAGLRARRVSRLADDYAVVSSVDEWAPCELEDDVRVLSARLDALPPKQREVIVRRFGLRGDPETLQEIADGLRLSRERIRQLEYLALERLREAYSA